MNKYVYGILNSCLFLFFTIQNIITLIFLYYFLD
jgi:hypothetical protein